MLVDAPAKQRQRSGLMSDPADRHRRLRVVLDEALLQDESTREAYVHRACADDPALETEVVRLLSAHEAAHTFLERPVPAALRSDAHFSGTERFDVVRRLGSGGMGVVYEVHDRVRDEVVALKTFLRSSGADLYRLKREFRSLADVTHPNLACLYELFVEEERCFFTMELVDGVRFVEYVSRRRSSPPFRRSTRAGAPAARAGRLGTAPAGHAAP